MKKRMFLALLALSAIVFSTGCSIKSTGLTESELNQVAEYTAKLLLRHTKGYEPNLIEKIEVVDDPGLVKEEFEELDGQADKDVAKPIKEDGNDEPETKPSDGSYADKDRKPSVKEEQEAESNITEPSKSLSELYGDAFEILYAGSGQYKKYPENEGYFSLVAPEDMKLFVAKFIVKNESKGRKRFKHDDKVKYSLRLKEGKIFRPSVTLLENDIKFLDVNIEAKKSAKGIVIFNIPSEASVKDAKIRVSDGEKMYEISVSH